MYTDFDARNPRMRSKEFQLREYLSERRSRRMRGLNVLTVVVDQASLNILTPGPSELDVPNVPPGTVNHLEAPNLRTTRNT